MDKGTSILSASDTANLIARYMAADLPMPEGLTRKLIVEIMEEDEVGEDKQTGCETPDTLRPVG